MFAVVAPKADVCFLCSRAGRGSLLSDSVDQPSLHRNLPEVLVPGPVPGGSDVIVLVEAWAWCVFKAPTQFRFLAEVENHRSRAGPAEGRACTVCVYTCARVCPRCLPFVYPQVHPSGVILLKSLPFAFYAKARTLSQMSPEPHLPPPGLHFTGHFLPLISCSL